LRFEAPRFIERDFAGLNVFLTRRAFVGYCASRHDAIRCVKRSQARQIATARHHSGQMPRMIVRQSRAPPPDPHRILSAGIFDVDGVLLASPHERAWREALTGFADPARFTTAIYQSQVAGKPRFSGALAALQALGVPNAAQRAEAYAESKQRRLEALIGAGAVSAFADALRFVNAVRTLGFPIAVASSSKNANDMIRRIPLDDHHSLFDVFGANVCGRDLPAGKPDPAIFLLAAAELPAVPEHCFVVEDAPAGIEAARAAGMAALGVARLHDATSLQAAGADLVVTSLDEVDLDQLSRGRLCRRIHEKS
jgi:HAD superfamily hydrolase (TIGR01509 family)